MYSYIIGEIKKIGNNYIIIENNNIGYRVYVGKLYCYEVGKEEKIYLYNHIKEDECSLYGFKNEVEYELFIKLISVKGLGVKVASSFFAVKQINEIVDAINKEDILFLKKIPKVGEKLAKQIILDLKGKINIEINDITNDVNDELILALESLGYKKIDINKIIVNVDKTKKLEEQIKESLRLLMK